MTFQLLSFSLPCSFPLSSHSLFLLFPLFLSPSFPPSVAYHVPTVSCSLTCGANKQACLYIYTVILVVDITDLQAAPRHLLAPPATEHVLYTDLLYNETVHQFHNTCQQFDHTVLTITNVCKSKMPTKSPKTTLAPGLSTCMLLF